MLLMNVLPISSFDSYPHLHTRLSEMFPFSKLQCASETRSGRLSRCLDDAIF